MADETNPCPLAPDYPAAELTRDARRARWARRISLAAGAAGLAVAVGNLLLAGGSQGVATIAGGVLIAAAALAFTVNGRIRRGIARRLPALTGPEALGPIVEAYAAAGLWRTPQATEALLAALRAAGPDRLPPLTARQRSYLHRMLTDDEPLYGGRVWGPDLKTAILEALTRMGDTDAIPRVEHLAMGAHDLRVRQAAVECLPHLRERVEAARSGKPEPPAGKQE